LKKILFFMTMLSCMFLTGCSFGLGIDNLITPPKLSIEQEKIYNTLTAAVGADISLKYPKTGNYISAFIIEDIDGDGTLEAIVFYEKKGIDATDNRLRISVLHKENNKWQSVCTVAADGTEIDKVFISKLGTNKRTNIVVGTNSLHSQNKTASVYVYHADRTVEEIPFELTFSERYSFLDVYDLDGDGDNEIILLNSSATATATASLYRLKPEGVYHRTFTPLSGVFTDFENIVYGNIGVDSGIFIDGVVDTNTVQTDIVYFDGTSLRRLFRDEIQCEATRRPFAYRTTDIDGDGIYEIPIPQKEDSGMTDWLYIRDGELTQKYSGYMSTGDGYSFLFPEKWNGRISVTYDTLNDEYVYRDTETKQELLRFFKAEDFAVREDRISMGYSILRSRGEIYYMLSVSENGELSMPLGTVASCFKFN